MGTRSIIVVKGKGQYQPTEVARLYKHWDGYPTGNLPIIQDALTRALKLEQENNERFKENRTITADVLASLIIGASVSIHGTGASLDVYDKDRAIYREFNLSCFGNQGDLEWIYLIDLESRSLFIFSTSYGTAEEAMKKGTANPMKYAEQLREECQDSERKETLELLTAIESLGFKVNPNFTKAMIPGLVKKRSKKSQAMESAS